MRRFSSAASNRQAAQYTIRREPPLKSGISNLRFSSAPRTRLPARTTPLAGRMWRSATLEFSFGGL
jgi:hypothetical protein